MHEARGERETSYDAVVKQRAAAAKGQLSRRIQSSSWKAKSKTDERRLNSPRLVLVSNGRVIIFAVLRVSIEFVGFETRVYGGGLG